MAIESTIHSICVYCGSSSGDDPAFVRAATQFGKILAENRIRLVYGGGSNGLMGAIAQSTHEHGGEITGVIPEFLRARERMFTRAQEMLVTTDMHDRKRLMFERADAFVALPGGIGTLEELVEQLTWAQLGRHRKPILLVNLQGYWNALIEVFDRMQQSGFIHRGALLTYRVCERVEDILPTLRAAVAAERADTRLDENAVLDRM